MSSIKKASKIESVDTSSSSTINQQLCDKSALTFESSDHKSSNATIINGSLITAGPTPPPSGTSSKSVPKKKPQIEQMFETFYQSPNGEFKPTFYNPFEVKHRRRTSRSQFKILERAFMDNCKPSAVVRKALAQELNMSARSIQVWFQNRRAKLKTMMKSGKMTEQQMMEYLQSQQNQQGGDDSEAQDQQDSPSSFEDSGEESESENVTPTDSKNGSFSVERRKFPNEAKQTINSIPIVCASEMMKLGNSYPNQVRNRSYSLPEIQRSPQLPFKQLQEALFGNSQHSQQIQQQHQHHHHHPHSQPQPQRQHATAESNYFNPSLNAFQHYFRASNAAMNHVNSNNQNGLNYFAAAPETIGQISVPQLNFTPLQPHAPTANPNTFEYQVDPNRFRPRSSSFAFGQRHSNPGNSVFSSNGGNNYETLSVIKEDSPITEYMSLPGSYESSHNPYFNNGNDHESTNLSNQINSLDLDYFMSTNGEYRPLPNHHPLQRGQIYPNYSSYDDSSSLSTSASQSPATSGNVSNDYMNELAFLPQPTNEILLSTLIDDDHFLH